MVTWLDYKQKGNLSTLLLLLLFSLSNKEMFKNKLLSLISKRE